MAVAENGGLHQVTRLYLHLGYHGYGVSYWEPGDLWDTSFKVRVSLDGLPTPFPCYEHLNSACKALELCCNYIELLHSGKGG